LRIERNGSFQVLCEKKVGSEELCLFQEAPEKEYGLSVKLSSL
jgi:hypothetical protein